VLRVLLLTFGIAAPLVPYARILSDGIPIRRAEFSGVQFLRNDRMAAGILNADNLPMITAGSNPEAALAAALRTWSGVPGSAVRFAPLGRTSSVNGTDDLNVFVMADTPEIRSVVGQALAVTLMAISSEGLILETDILFNPNIVRDGRRLPFSTNLAPNTVDLQTIALHELGHALGANHSNLLAATMFEFTPSQTRFQSTLSPDDAAFLHEVYPAEGIEISLGALRGTVRSPAGPVRGALVTAVDPATGVAVGVLSSIADGTWAIPRLPPGRYLVYAEPLDGPVTPASMRLAGSDVDAAFRTGFLGGAASPQTVEVSPGTDAVAEIVVDDGPSDLDLRLVTLGALSGAGDFRDIRPGALQLTAGTPVDVLLSGTGLEGLTESEIEFYGGGIRIVPGSVRTDARLRFDGVAPTRMSLFVPVRAARTISTLVIRRGGLAAVHSGGFVVEGVPTPPIFSASGIVNAVSLAPGGIVPGEIVSIAGRDLGPIPGVGIGTLTAPSEDLPTVLAGTTVEMDGLPAPLFFVSETEIRAQVPWAMAGRNTATVRVIVNNSTSAALSLKVLAARPGVFAMNGQAIATNEDSSPNNPGNPASRDSEIVLHATGLGVAEGDPPAHNDLLALSIDGRPARVLYARPRPDLAGVSEIRALVPMGAQPGAAPVQIAIGGASSQAGVTVAVK
jgi:uncharacterized protein (TIGR03437 family)